MSHQNHQSGLSLSLSNMPSVLLTWNDIKDKLADVCEAGDVDGLKDHYEVLPTNRQPLSIDSKVNAGDENCLHIVVRNGHVTCAEYLLARGAGVNVTGKKGMAAVHLAAIRGDLRMLDMIVESGGDITLLDNGFASPLYYAAKYGRIECVRYLLSKHKENERKTVTCHYVDVPCKAPKWETPLWVAVRQGYVEIVALLVTSGCHLEQRDPNGWTVLHAACKRSNVEVVKTLLKLKPSAIKHMVTVTCDDGYPIHLACHFSSLDVIRLLISHHSPLNKFNSFGCTPLMVCCQSGQYQTVQLLLDAGADPNLVSPISKKTAMHWAVNRRDLQRVWLLLQFGGDQRTRKDGLSVTPRQMAERQLARATRKGGAGYTPSGFVSPRDVMCLREMMDSLNYFDGRLRTLYELSRVSIRQLLGPSRIDKVDQLPLPPSLRVYLKDMFYRSPPDSR